ncbi:MAG: SDR family NAD(P)-dependent oxidoreductase [Methylococcales bacterium]|nr:SDR family NAD(P)-dependent oxidoreductase [Methylococcales bacterium]
MNILLTGASGFIGHHILNALEQQNYNVTACCRRPEKLVFKSESTRILQLDYADMMTETDWLPHLQNIDVVINCVGIIVESKQQTFQTLHAKVPTALFNAAEQAAVKKVIQISALGADQKAQSAYHLSKKAADDALKNLTMDWYVLQPSIVYGDGAQSMALFHALAALPIHALIDGGEQLMQPVHVSDLVETVVQCLKPDSVACVTLPLIGPEAISFKYLLEQLRQRLGKKPAVTFSLPGELAQRSVFIGKWLGEPTFNAENIAMLRQGNSANAEPIKQFLGRATKSLQEKLLQSPANQAERWHAGLYFLRPLLRLSIAFLWIWSGVVSIFFFPVEQSYQFLAVSGITGNAAPVMLYGLALMDIVIGLATLTAYRIRPLILFQLTIIFLYTLMITFTLPEFWLHPFGPVLKNIPLLTTLLVYLIIEGEKP